MRGDLYISPVYIIGLLSSLSLHFPPKKCIKGIMGERFTKIRVVSTNIYSTAKNNKI